MSLRQMGGPGNKLAQESEERLEMRPFLRVLPLAVKGRVGSEEELMCDQNEFQSGLVKLQCLGHI